MNRRSQHRFFDGLYIGVLFLYLVAGMRTAPFHGDESTIIYMSHDWYTLVQSRDITSLLYRDSPLDPKSESDQSLRLLNGVISKYSIGFMAMLGGIADKDLNEPWDWSLDWWANGYFRHFPTEPLLLLARMSSTLMLGISIAAVFATARLLAGRAAGWVASFLYTMMPAVLLNGRRAMFEGADLMGITLVILAGVLVASRMKLSDRRTDVKYWLLLGAASGLALASKHTTALVIAPVFGTLFLLNWRRFGQTIRCAAGVAVVAGLVFLALNPAWWADPLRMPGRVLSMRSSLLSSQTSGYGSYTGITDRLTALVEYPIGQPQYAEDAKYDWTQWIGSDIKAYETSGLAGLWGPVSNIGFILLMLAGAALIVWALGPGRTQLSFNRPSLVVFLVVFVSGVASVFAFTPLAWQRYYLPLTAPMAILGGLSAGWRNYVRQS